MSKNINENDFSVLEKQVLKPKDISTILDIGMNSVYQLLTLEEFKVLKLGTDYRIPKRGFFDWLNK